MRYLLIITLIFLGFSCKENHNSKSPTIKAESTQLFYAKGFSITHFENYTELHINRPWPNANKSYTYALVNSKNAPLETPHKFDGIIEIPLKKLIVTSTTHLPALELLHQEKSLIGFPGCDYVSSPVVRSLIDDEHIRELGQNESLNTEVILSLNPDALIGFGIDGTNKAFETLNNSGIPIIYNGDWAENSPLAKAEWLKFFGVLFQKERAADSIFSSIESNYNTAKALAQKSQTQPTVMSGAMHKDIWYLPNGTSPEGQFLKDANLNYLWKDSTGSGSLALSFESVFVKAKDAEIWLNPSNFSSYQQLNQNNNLYSKFSAFRNKTIYSMSLTQGATGGVIYYELGSTRPDLVLKDLIKIGHPQLLNDYQLTFFKPLNLK